MVELADLTYAVAGKTIVDGVSARFRDGAFNVVLGPNGAGKSTLLRLATGLLRPTAGQVRYDGVPVASLAPEALARTRAVLSQHVELAFPLSVEEVAMMGRYPHFGRAPGPRDRDVVARALAMVGMDDRRAQPYPTLSGGERQKVQMARVLAQIWADEVDGRSLGGAARRYLFLDEPTSSLDVHYQLHLLDVARHLTRQGCTVVAVLHDLNTAFRYADAFFVMEDGRVALETESADLVPPALVERVFRVRARRVRDEAAGESVWTFTL